MEYEVMYLCNVIGVSVLFMIAAFTLIGVDKEKNTDTFEMWAWIDESGQTLTYLNYSLNQEFQNTNIFSILINVHYFCA